MAEINLLPAEERSAEGFEGIYGKVLIAGVAMVLISGMLTLAVLGYFSALSSKRSEYISRVEQSSATINSLKSTEELIVVVKEKASIADKILTARSPFGDVFSKLVQLVPQGVFFTDMKFSGLKVTVSGKAKSSADVSGFIDQLVSEKGSEIFLDVSVDSLASDDTGVYSFVLTARLVK